MGPDFVPASPDSEQDLLVDIEAAGAEGARVGRDRAIRMLAEAPRYADGVYLIAPFKRPDQVVPLIDEAGVAG